MIMELFTTKIKIILFVIIGLIVISALYFFVFRVRRNGIGAQRSQFTIPAEKVHKEILANGMHVLVFKNAAMPKVLVQIAYDVGSYVESSGERGLAHLIEHMIFKGTEKLSESDIDTIARKYGASFNAFTSLDITSYYFEADKNNWKPFVEILADCMQNARFEEQHLASELKTVIQELKMNKDNYWKMMMEKACELVFPSNHPYHTPIIGFKEDLLNLNAENLKKFYKKYYRPDRATLFIVGDVDFKDAVTEAKKHFESIKAAQDSVVQDFPAVIPELVTHHTRYYQDVKHEQLGFYWIIPGIKSEDEITISMVEAILGNGQSSKIYRLLVDEKRVATTVYVRGVKFMQAGVFLILVEPMEGKSDACMQLVQNEIEKIIKDGVDPIELERVAKNKSKNFFLKMQDYSDFTYNWITSYFSTHDELHVFKRLNKYYQIDSAQVQTFVKTHLDPFLMNRIEVLPLPDSKRSMREAIKRMSDELDKKILARHVRTTPVEEPRMAKELKHPDPLAFSFPKPEKVITLANGLKILLLPNKQVPLIAVNCQFKESLFLSDAKDGIPVEVMMDMLMEGTKQHDKHDNVEFFENRGASYAFDTQGGSFLCLREDFDALLGRFYAILHDPTFPQESLDKIKQIFIDNYLRAKDSPRMMAARILKNELYKDHPYEWTFDQAHDLVKGLDQEALHKLHEQYVCPANMILSVVGDFDVEAMASEIERVLGPWKTGTQKTFDKVTHAFKKGIKIDHHMLRDQVVLVLGQPSPITIYNPDLIPLKLLNIIGFRSLGSRIYRLREQTGLFYNAFGAFAAGATKEQGYDFVGMIVSPENVDVAEVQMRHMLALIAKTGITLEELDAARQMYLKDLIDLIADNSAIARLLCMLDALDLGFDYYDKVLARVQTIGTDEINTIAAKYCIPDSMVRVRVGPLGNNK
jgi:zinc protease